MGSLPVRYFFLQIFCCWGNARELNPLDFLAPRGRRRRIVLRFPASASRLRIYYYRIRRQFNYSRTPYRFHWKNSSCESREILNKMFWNLESDWLWKIGRNNRTVAIFQENRRFTSFFTKCCSSWKYHKNWNCHDFSRFSL